MEAQKTSPSLSESAVGGVIEAVTAETVSIRTRIREIPADERPRERLARCGPDALSASELLAIVLRTGSGGQSALALAESLLARFGGLRPLAAATAAELSEVPGMGAAKAAQVQASMELGRRLMASAGEERPRIRSPRDVYTLLSPSLRDERREHFVVLLLDTRNGVMRHRTVSVGDLSSSIVHPREVFTEAIRHGAASLIVAHNHPSGDPVPSPEDAAVTKRLAEAGQLLGIELLDHIVLGDGRFVSLKERGLF